LHYVVKKYADEVVKKPVCVLMDAHGSHWHQSVVTRAAAYGITLLRVPTGLTSVLQPLDIRVNGCIKSSMRKSWHDHVLEDSLHNRSHKVAIRDFIDAYSKITKDVIVESFHLMDK